MPMRCKLQEKIASCDSAFNSPDIYIAIYIFEKCNMT